MVPLHTGHEALALGSVLRRRRTGRHRQRRRRRWSVCHDGGIPIARRSGLVDLAAHSIGKGHREPRLCALWCRCDHTLAQLELQRAHGLGHEHVFDLDVGFGLEVLPGKHRLKRDLGAVGQVEVGLKDLRCRAGGHELGVAVASARATEPRVSAARGQAAVQGIQRHNPG